MNIYAYRYITHKQQISVQVFNILKFSPNFVKYLTFTFVLYSSLVKLRLTQKAEISIQEVKIFLSTVTFAEKYKSIF